MRWRHHRGRSSAPFVLPDAPVVINLRHFLAPRLARVWLPGMPDRAAPSATDGEASVTGALRCLSIDPTLNNEGAIAGSTTQTILRETDWAGTAAVFNGSTTEYRRGSNQPWRPDLALPAPITMMAVCRPSLVAGRVIYSISNGSPTFGEPRVQLSVEPGGMGFLYLREFASFCNIIDTNSYLAGDLLVLAGTTRSNTDHALASLNVRTGVCQLTTSSTNVTGTATTTPTEQIGTILSNGGASAYFQGGIYMCAMGVFGVTNADLLALVADPYAILAPAARPEWRPGFSVAALQRRRRIVSAFMDDRGVS